MILIMIKKLMIHVSSNMNHNMSNIYLERLKDVKKKNGIKRFQKKLNVMNHVFANYGKYVLNLQCMVVVH